MTERDFSIVTDRRVAAEIYDLAVDMANPAHPTTVFSVQAGVSIRLEIIAKALFQCAWILTGKQTTREWNELTLALQQRYRYLAERAIATIDPKVRLDAQEEAAKEIAGEWINGPGSMDAITNVELAREAIGLYEAKLAGVRVNVEAL